MTATPRTQKALKTRRAAARRQDRKKRLDATPERLARAREAGQTERTRQRPAAPHPRPVRRHALDPRAGAARSQAQRHALADRRGAAPRASARAVSTRCAPSSRRQSAHGGFGPRTGLPASEIALHARDKIRIAEQKAGPAAWPIVTRIVIEGARRARLPRLRLRDRHALARRRRRHRSPARRAGRARRTHGGDGA